MSFNIRYGTADDGPNRWELRRDLVFQTMKSESYDFIGLQEALPFQLEEISTAMAKYGMHYRTRESDPDQGEACAILYREDRWQLDRRQRGTFWLSEQPEVAGSKSWDSSLPRIVTWGRFTHRDSGARLYVFNTHFDHRGQLARRKSAQLLRSKVADLAASEPVLVIGDFNAGEKDTAMDELRAATQLSLRLVDSFRLDKPHAEEVYTFNGWGDRTEGEKIDAIFVRAGADVVEAAILRPRFSGRAPSDHDPVTVSLRLHLDEVVLEIADLSGCRSCAGAIERALRKVEGVLRAELHPSEPWITVGVSSSVDLADQALAEAVRDAGYMVGSIRRR